MNWCDSVGFYLFVSYLGLENVHASHDIQDVIVISVISGHDQEKN